MTPAALALSAALAAILDGPGNDNGDSREPGSGGRFTGMAGTGDAELTLAPATAPR